MSKRFLTAGALALAGGAGYYMYQAGGDPKAAEKRAEADVTKLGHDVRSHLPGSKDEIKKDAEVVRADLDAKANELYKDARDGMHKVDAKLMHYRDEAEKEAKQKMHAAGDNMNKAIGKFDKNVSESAEKTKSNVSSWFGGSK